MGDPNGYTPGHFSRVYQYIMVPACRQAGFSPVRADDMTVSETTLDVIKNIVECELVISDISSKDVNAQYGFALRRGINLPVILIKDSKTSMVFDMKEFGLIEYDESLRVDTVQKEVETLSSALTKAFASKDVVNPLLSRLDIKSGSSMETSTLPEPEVTLEVPRESKKEESHLPVISPVPDYVGDPITQIEEMDKMKVGDFLFHRNYGKGEIRSISKMAKDKVAKIQFESESKMLVLGISGIFRKII